MFYFTPCKCFLSRTGTKQDHLSCLGFDLCSVYVLVFVVVCLFLLLLLFYQKGFLSMKEWILIQQIMYCLPIFQRFNHLVKLDLLWTVQS